MACISAMAIKTDIHDDSKARALGILRAGGLAAVPTETVYGLAADATNEAAIASIYAAKGRPSHNPLIVHVDGIEMANRYVHVDDLSQRLIDAFWPGPLTLVLPLRADAGLAKAVTAGLPTLAIRQPIGIMADLAGALGAPVAAPSANISGRLSPTCAEHVEDGLGNKVGIILDAGACTVGVESTIVKVSKDTVILLRQGGLPVEEIEALLGQRVVLPSTDANIESPGQLLAHYAPSKPLRLNAEQVDKKEAWLVFGDTPDHDGPMLNLSPDGDLVQAAHNVFAYLKSLDESEAVSIAVQPIPSTGLGAAINDRLEKAAHGAKEANNV